MSVSSPSTSISSQITIHSVFKADEQQIRDLFHADVYHWTRRARPILFNGILSLFKIPICVWLSITIGVGLCHDVNLAKWLVWALALILLVLFISKLLLSLIYFWYLIPEFKNRNLTEFYSRDGFAFLDASSHLYKRVCPLVGRSVCP